MSTGDFQIARVIVECAVSLYDSRADRRRAARRAWRGFQIETERLAEIARAAARGAFLVEASAARGDDPTRRLRLHNGSWQMRITLTKDPKLVGSQKTIPLETADLLEAQAKRDFLERTFDRLGLLSSRATAGMG